MKKLIRIPSPSTGISLLALFIALTGTAYAASLPKNSVGGKQIKKNAVSSSKIKTSGVLSSDVKNDALTGDDINESTLGTVPNATNATNATTAVTAQSVGGSNITKINYRGENGTAPITVFDAGGLKLTAGCAASAPSLQANTSTDDAMIHWQIGRLTSVTAANEGTIHAYEEDDNFDISDNVDLLSLTNTLAGSNDDSTQGTMTYTNSAGSVVTVTYMVEDGTNVLGGTADCIVIGNAVVS